MFIVLLTSPIEARKPLENRTVETTPDRSKDVSLPGHNVNWLCQNAF